MRRVSLLAAASLAAVACSLKTSEPVFAVDTLGVPVNWTFVGTPAATGSKYSIGVTTAGVHGGSKALFVLGADRTNTLTFSGIGQSIRADNYRGKRVRFTAWARHEGLAGKDIGLWMRVDGPGVTSAFDNFSTRSLAGTSDWHQLEIILDVADDAIGIAFGVLMGGGGMLVVDDMKWEIIPANGPTTDQLIGPTATTFDARAAYAANTRFAPQNLDFEGR